MMVKNTNIFRSLRDCTYSNIGNRIALKNEKHLYCIVRSKKARHVECESNNLNEKNNGLINS